MEKEIKIKIEKSEVKETSVFGGIQGEGGARTLKINFDSEWDGLTKKITFFDAAMQNPVIVALTEDKKENGEYSVKIPSEPLKTGGKFTFIIDGTAEGIRQRSVQRELRVKYAYPSKGSEEIEAITQTVAEQLTSSINSSIEKTTELSTEIEGNKTEISNLKERATSAEASLALKADKTELPQKVSELENDSGYLTEHQSLADYAKKAELPQKVSELENDSGYLTEHQSLADYAKKTELPQKVSELENDSGYLTEHQSLADYAKKTDVLTKTNTSEYIPTESYHPATKKYAEKYADGIMENLKKLSVPQRKAEGNPLAITDGLADEAPLELKVYGNYGKNLIPYPYADTTKTENGITFTDNGDGTVTVNGTATANSQVWFTLNTNVEKLLDVTKTYVMSYVMSGGSNSNVFLYMSLLKDNNWVGEIGAWSSAGVKINLSTVTKEYDTIKLSIGVMKGTAVDSITIKPQLKLYEALGDLNSSSGKYEVQVFSTGKNLIPYPYANTTKTDNGITFTDNGDGSITINGTATNTTFCHLLPTNKKNLSPGKYIHTDNASKETDFHFSALVRKNSTNVIISSSGTSFDISDIDYDFVWYVMTIKEGDTVDNVTYKPQLELGEVATEYEPYVSGGDVTAAMGSQLKPGEYIDLLRKKKISNGTETDISVSGGIKIPESEMCYIQANTKISPEKIEVTYFQDINKVIGEIKKSILSQGGNV